MPSSWTPLYELFGIKGQAGGQAPAIPDRPHTSTGIRKPTCLLLSHHRHIQPRLPQRGVPLSDPRVPDRARRQLVFLPPNKDASETDYRQVAKVDSEWTLPRLAPTTRSRTIRGPTPIEAGAALAVPAPVQEPANNGHAEQTTLESAAASALAGETPGGTEHGCCKQNSQQKLRPGSTTTTRSTTTTALAGETPDPTNTIEDGTLEDGNTQTDAAGDATFPTPRLLDELQQPREEPAEAPTHLAPLLPGWAHVETFTEGLHPSTDVFDDAQYVALVADQPTDSGSQADADEQYLQGQPPSARSPPHSLAEHDLQPERERSLPDHGDATTTAGGAEHTAGDVPVCEKGAAHTPASFFETPRGNKPRRAHKPHLN